GEVVVVLGDALAVVDEVGLGLAVVLEVGLAVGAEVEDRVVLGVAEVVGRERDGTGTELDAPGVEGLEGAVVIGDDGLGRAGDGLCAVVVLDLDGAAGAFGAGLALIGAGRAAARQGEGKDAGQSAEL